MSSGGRAPEAPDPARTIALQEAADRRNFQMQLRASRPNTSNPYGNSTWTPTTTFDQAGYDQANKDWETQYNTPLMTWKPRYEGTGDSGHGAYEAGYYPTEGRASTGDAPPRPDRGMYETVDYSQSYDFDPEVQQDWDALYGKLQDTLQNMPNQANLDLIDDAGGLYSDNLADAIYRRTTRMSGDSMGQAQTALEQRLAERGFQVGNEGYNTEMDRFGRGMSEHYGDAADRAQITASQQALQEADFTNTARLAEFQGDTNYRSQMAQLLSGQLNTMFGGLTGNPSSVAAPNLPGIDILGAYQNKYNADVNAYNADQAGDFDLFNTILNAGMGFATGGPAGAAAGGLSGVFGGGASSPGGSIYTLPTSGRSRPGLRF